VAKRDGPSKRLRAAIARAKRGRTGDPPPVPEFTAITIHLDRGPWWKPVAKAFRAFGYDVRNPQDWECLLHALADAHFGEPRRKPKFWNEGRLCQLACDFARAKAANPGKTDEAIRKLLVKGERYRKVRSETIRRLMPAARKVLAEAVSFYAECAQENREPTPPFAPRPWSNTPVSTKDVEAWIIEQYAAFKGQPVMPDWDLDDLDDLIARLRGNLPPT
jgi:hypothetical protein